MTSLHRTKHSIVVDSPAETVFRLVENVGWWPVVFGPTVYVRHLWRDGDQERFQIWATANGKVANWTSKRRLDPRALRIEFRQERSTPPVASMGGVWEFLPLSDQRTEVVLRHHFSTIDEQPDSVAWVTKALDTNSTAELGALGRVADTGLAPEDIVFSFHDEVVLAGSVADAYEFVHRADRWLERLPHVARIVLTDLEPDVQEIEMDTRSTSGAAHTTRSFRICFDNELIAYKQTLLPSMLTGHSGQWRFLPGDNGLVLQSHHTVAINPAAIEGMLGANKTLADARRAIRDSLGANSRATLALAAEFADQRAGVTLSERGTV